MSDESTSGQPNLFPTTTNSGDRLEHSKNLSTKEALAVLEGKTYVPKRSSIYEIIQNVDRAARSPNSIYAAKLSAASVVFGALLWSNGTRAFFLKYTLSSSLLTVVVALSPTLGQSLRSFVFQIAGSSLGYIAGMVILEIFRADTTSGYHFNPIGIPFLVALYTFPLAWMLYERPQYFTFSLLALNGCGVVIIQEYVNLQYSKDWSYGEPPTRAARSLTGLAIAIAIVLAFQFLVLRNPARRDLRKAMAGVVFSLTSYNNLLTAFVRATMPSDGAGRPLQSVVDQVLAELVHREREIQGQIIGLMPLIMFARDEPQMGKPFQIGAIMKIVRSSQLILDRESEARHALGSRPLGPQISQFFLPELAPYRARIVKIIKARMCLVAASLSSKQPLPHDMEVKSLLGHVTRDALVLSRNFAHSEEGKLAIRSGDFTRYWFYLLSMSSVLEHVKAIEESCKTLFGEIEDDPRLK